MTDFRAIEGLHDFWTRMSGGTAAPVPMRPLFDTLVLGLGQVMTQVGRTRPDWDAFVAWIMATAGEADATALARYHA